MIYSPRAQAEVNKSRIHKVSKNNGLIFHVGEVSELCRKTVVKGVLPFQRLVYQLLDEAKVISPQSCMTAVLFRPLTISSPAKTQKTISSFKHLLSFLFANRCNSQ